MGHRSGAPMTVVEARMDTEGGMQVERKLRKRLAQEGKLPESTCSGARLRAGPMARGPRPEGVERNGDQSPPVYSRRSGEPCPRPVSTSGVAPSTSQSSISFGRAAGWASL